ncbi:MAG: DUF4392 domain-containing protein [Planctomycetia bacterium]|nr:DUF4392 domain-containing protein [Planctomycetia bacterium]
MESELRFQALAALLTNDPSQRGVAGLRPWGAKSAAAALHDTAETLLTRCQHIGIVTGFYIPAANPPAAETDGPLGALALAHALTLSGKVVDLVTDHYAAAVLEKGSRIRDLRSRIYLSPEYHDDTTDFKLARTMSFDIAGASRRWDALISIERAGPSHHAQSALRGAINRELTAALFDAEVPPEHRDRRHDMRGVIIDHITPPLDALFEEIKATRPDVYTLGIGDGGNEIGMGCFPWEQLRAAIQLGPGVQLACRIATDEVITAGTSNWGAYALVAALGILDPKLPAREILNVEDERTLLTRLVTEAGAVDGVTLQREPTVDGLSSDDYFAVMNELRNV